VRVGLRVTTHTNTHNTHKR